jgi:hypothetical protein
MTWDRRLRELVLAGGALATAACGGSVAHSVFDDAGSIDGTTGQDASDELSSGGGACCNANPDPCCPSQYCGSSPTEQCFQEMECQEAGRWNAMTYTCEAPTPPFDSGEADSAHLDASRDAIDESSGD